MIHYIRKFEATKTTSESKKSKDAAKSKELPDRKKFMSELVALCKELVDESHKIPILDDTLFEDVQAKLDSQKPTITKTSLRYITDILK
jgi:hypothetical protein